MPAPATTARRRSPYGTRIYAPTANEPRAAAAGGARLFHKFAGEDDARATARELEAYLADRTPWRSSPDAPRTVAALSKGYLEHLVSARCATGSARRRCWVLPDWATWR